MQEKLDLKSMSFAQVRALCDSLGFPAFRAGQIFAWCGRGITAFSEMTDQNKADRAALQAKTCLTPCKIAEKFVSTLDGTAKYLIKLQNGYTVEAVVMRYRYGLSACLSTQAGCRMGCAFCASTVNGLGRNLSAGEILDQYLLLSKDQGERIGSVVLMGMGEPLDNYDNVVRFLENIADPMGVGLSHRHITLSTCGLADPDPRPCAAAPADHARRLPARAERRAAPGAYARRPPVGPRRTAQRLRLLRTHDRPAHLV